MNWTEADGIGLRYDLTGRGQDTVALIHEMGGTLETWDLVVPLLSREARVLRFDMRGAGMSEKVRGGLRIETLADDLLALLDRLALVDPVILVGCAVGAAAAMCFAARHAQRAAGLIALSPSVGVAAAQRPSRLKQADEVEHAGMRVLMEEAFERGYPPMFRARDPERFASFRARWLGNDPGSFVAMSRMLIHLDLDAYLPQIRCPALVVGGTHDGFRPPTSSEEVARRIPGAQFRVLETSHHMPVQTPELVADVIKEFLRHVASGAAGSQGNARP